MSAAPIVHTSVGVALPGVRLVGGDQARKAKSEKRKAKMKRGRPITSSPQHGAAGAGGDVRLSNTQVVMTCAAEAPPAPRLAHHRGAVALVATRDPFDRAHNVHGGDGEYLVPAAKRDWRTGAVRPTLNGQARPRKYPACYMTGLPGGARVSFESANDDLYEREQRLRAMGLEVGGTGNVAELVRQAVTAWAGARGRARGGGGSLRGVLEGPTRQADWVTGEVS